MMERKHAFQKNACHRSIIAAPAIAARWMADPPALNGETMLDSSEQPVAGPRSG